MPVTLAGNVANVTIGPAALYVAPVGIAIPNLTGNVSDFSAFTNPGYTNDGIEWDYTASFYDVKVDEILGPVQKQITMHKLTMTTKLSEATLANLALTCAGATLVGTNKVTFGSVTSPPLYVIGFMGPAANGLTRQGIVFRSVAMGASKIHSHRKTEITYTLTLEALSDSTQPTAQDLAIFQDF